jgi:hypothetical protein
MSNVEVENPTLIPPLRKGERLAFHRSPQHGPLRGNDKSVVSCQWSVDSKKASLRKAESLEAITCLKLLSTSKN